VRDKNEGAVVFATPSIKLASCYLFRWDDSWVHQFISNKDNGSYEVFMVISDRKRFNAEDMGGAIYLLPPISFHSDEEKGLGIYEMVSNRSVVPYAHINFESALSTMQKFGVQVYFVNPTEFKAFLKSKGDEQQKFLDSLK
jgi:hypothetical protein